MAIGETVFTQYILNTLAQKDACKYKTRCKH